MIRERGTEYGTVIAEEWREDAWHEVAAPSPPETVERAVAPVQAPQRARRKRV